MTMSANRLHRGARKGAEHKQKAAISAAAQVHLKSQVWNL
jgi:hypothetical protein